MFKGAIKQSLKAKGKTYSWLSNKTGIPIASIKAYMSKCLGSNLCITRVEKIFEVLGIELKLQRSERNERNKPRRT
jgi:hypothetical protein